MIFKKRYYFLILLIPAQMILSMEMPSNQTNVIAASELTKEQLVKLISIQQVVPRQITPNERDYYVNMDEDYFVSAQVTDRHPKIKEYYCKKCFVQKNDYQPSFTLTDFKTHYSVWRKNNTWDKKNPNYHQPMFGWTKADINKKILNELKKFQDLKN